MFFKNASLPLFKRLPGIIAPLAMLGLLTACGHVPMRSIPALAAIDFRTTQFQALRAAIELPDTLLPRPGGVRLNVVLSIEGAVAEERSYALIQTSLAQGEQALAIAPQAGRHAFIYRLTDADQMGMDAIRRAILTAEQAGQSGSLNLRVSVENICARAPLDDDQLLVDVFLKTSETDRFVRTLDGYDLRELGAADAGIEESIRLCL